MLGMNSWDFQCGDVLWKALQSTGIYHSFIQDKYVGEISRSPFWLPESALELSTGRCWERQPQMVQVHNYFSWNQNNQTHIRVLLHCVWPGNCFITVARPPSKPFNNYKEKMFLLQNRETDQIKQGIMYFIWRYKCHS